MARSWRIRLTAVRLASKQQMSQEIQECPYRQCSWIFFAFAEENSTFSRAM